MVYRKTDDASQKICPNNYQRELAIVAFGDERGNLMREGRLRHSPLARILSTLLLLFAFQASQAAIVVYEFDYDFSDVSDPDSASPIGASPWLTATFDDGGTAGSVTLTLEFGADNGSATVNDVYFNLDPLLSAGDLTFSYVSGELATVDTSGSTADGAGEFDFFLDYFPPPGGDTFSAGETSVYTITGAGLDAFSFSFLSENPETTGAKFAAAQILSTGDGLQSAWVGIVPIPAAAWLFGSALGLLGWFKRRSM